MTVTIPEGFIVYRGRERMRLIESVQVKVIPAPILPIDVKVSEQETKDYINRQVMQESEQFDKWCKSHYPNEHWKTDISYLRFTPKGVVHWAIEHGEGYMMTSCGLIHDKRDEDVSMIAVDDVKTQRMCKICKIRKTPFTSQEYRESF